LRPYAPTWHQGTGKGEGEASNLLGNVIDTCLLRLHEAKDWCIDSDVIAAAHFRL